MKQQKKLMRSTNKMLAGVCAGIGEFFGVDPTLIRILYVALSIFSVGFPGVIFYIILMILMPLPQNTDNESDSNNE